MILPFRTVVILCLGSLAIGAALMFRLTPERTEEHLRIVELRWRHVAEKTRETTHQVAVRDRWRTRTVVIDRTPDGASRTEIREAEGDHATASADRETTTARTETERVDTRLESERITAPALPRLSVGASVGLDVRALSPVYQVDVGYRLIGPLSVTGAVQMSQAELRPVVFVGARWAF